MITFLNTEEHRLDLIVLRGLGDTPENFKRSDVKVLAVNSHNKIPLTCEIKDIYDNHLYCWLPSGMESGVYALEVYWTKGRGGLKVNNLNSSVYMYARTPECFAVTSNYDESTNLADNQAVEIKMRSASFGYDGLSAYELAVLRGDYSGSEEEWTDLHLGMRLDTDNNILTLGGVRWKLTRAVDIALTVTDDGAGTITMVSEGDSIYYTTDGTTPTRLNGTLYKEPFTVTDSCTIKAIAYKDNDCSEIVTHEITLAPHKVSEEWNAITSAVLTYASSAASAAGSKTPQPTLKVFMNKIEKYSDGSTVTTDPIDVTSDVVITSGSYKSSNTNTSVDDNGVVTFTNANTNSTDATAEISVTITVNGKTGTAKGTAKQSGVTYQAYIGISATKPTALTGSPKTLSATAATTIQTDNASSGEKYAYVFVPSGFEVSTWKPSDESEDEMSLGFVDQETIGDYTLYYYFEELGLGDFYKITIKKKA